MKTAGLIVFIAGLLMTIYSGFLYISRERAIGLEALGITRFNNQTIYWQPYIGIGVMVVGGACLALGRNKALTR